LTKYTMVKLNLHSLTNAKNKRSHITEAPAVEKAPPANELLLEQLHKKLAQPPKPKKPQEQSVAPQSSPPVDMTRQKKKLLIDLYLREFPEKLKKYKTRKTDKATDDELDSLIKELQTEVNSTSNIGMVTESAVYALQLYEYIMAEYVGVNVTGVSAIANTPEFQETLKATLLKYVGGSLISVCEPEMKLIYLLLTASFVTNAGHNMAATRGTPTTVPAPHQVPAPAPMPAPTSGPAQEQAPRLDLWALTPTKPSATDLTKLNDEFQDL
jgi:hypothetical protein